MIHNLAIRNFKSIRELDLGCRRVNVFIGEPNAGKTNILEALALRCPQIYGDTFNDAMRIRSVTDLFWNQTVTSDPLKVDFGYGETTTVWATHPPPSIDIEGPGSNKFQVSPYKQLVVGDSEIRDATSYYLFQRPTGPSAFSEKLDRLEPPFGTNFGSLLYGNRDVRISAAAFFEGSGFKLNVEQTGFKVLITKELEGVLMSLSYTAASETLRRMIFYHLILDTNRDQILVLDEPEAHSFPPYTKTLAERIALDDRGNQFFLTTHSPYMLDSLLSKTPAKDLNVVLCRIENYETKVYPLNQSQIDQIKEWSMDAFFNFDRLLPEVG